MRRNFYPDEDEIEVLKIMCDINRGIAVKSKGIGWGAEREGEGTIFYGLR